LNIVNQCDAPTMVKPSNPKAVKYVLNGKEIKYKVAKVTHTPSKIHTKPTVCTFTYAVTVPAELKKIATYDSASGSIKMKGSGGVKAGTYKITVQAKSTTSKSLMTNGKYEMSFIIEAAPKKDTIIVN
jgi:hypothetical protein